jgi:hypothetical protein
MYKYLFILLSSAASFSQCSQNHPNATQSLGSANANQQPIAAPVTTPEFNAYWYNGKAELTSYTMQQDRYGQMRETEQVNIFVTEDLSASKQVKLDDAAAAGNDRVPVLKLNSVRRFETGIYDYSMMSSVFTPIRAGQPSLKLTATIQDWCGHTFTQINRADKNWQWRQFSYFEKEADTDLKLADCMLEDELFTHLRLNPDVGTRKVSMLPGIFYLRMKHLPTQARTAEITTTFQDNQRVTVVNYLDLPRRITITQEQAFPYKILAWEETESNKIWASAKLNRTVITDYWAKNGNEFVGYRDSLGLK